MSRVNLAYPINTLWMLSCRRSLKAFHHSIDRVEVTQSHVLRQIIRANRDSEFGRKHHFDQIQNTTDFRELVPTGDYGLYEPWIDQICKGHSRILTTEPVRLLEPTSGSVAGQRLIPYTDSLKNEFQNGINPWIADLFSARPHLRAGRAYWLVSPPVKRQRTSGELEIGFADDMQYLGLTGRLAAGRVMAVPPWTMDGIHTERAPYQTLLRLLPAKDLTLISVWSPTLLANLMRLLENTQDRIVRDLQTTLPTIVVSRIRSILRSDERLSEKTAQLWPNLGLISCWADGSATNHVHEITKLFPHVEIQAKGLISTEAFVSLPIVGQVGSALSIRSHFFEFQSIAASGSSTLLAHELHAGDRYRVIVTTGGGLYRYQTHDVVEVVGFLGQCPLIRFCGRANKTSDLVGEKLTDVFVGLAIERLATQLQIKPTFAMLVPQQSAPGYHLLIELLSDSKQASATQISAAFELLLAENPWYAHAVSVGQLLPVKVTIDTSRSGRLWNAFETRCLNSGIRRGDIKPPALETRFDWDLTSGFPGIG